MNLKSSLLFAALAVSPLMSIAQSGARPYLAIVEKAAGRVGFYTEDGRRVGEVAVGAFPHEAVLSRDGRLLFVSDNGVLWMQEDAQGGNTISVVDVQAMRRTAQIDLGRFHRPHGIAVVPGSDELLVTTERPFGLVRVDPAARRVVRDYDVKGKSPHMVMPAPDGKSAFVSNTDSNTVAAVDLETGEATLIPTAARPQGGVFSVAGDRLYVVCTAGNLIEIVDVRRRQVVGEIPTGKGPGRVALTPDGRRLVYNLQFEPGVGMADLDSGKQVGAVAVSGRPLSLTMSPDGRRVFAGIQEQDKVFVISVPELKIDRVIELPKGSGPDPAIALW